MHTKTLTIQTHQKTEVLNVTDQLAGMVADVAQGLALFNVPHTTAALIVCEDDDELRDDLARAAENLFADLRPFKHRRNHNPNAEAHLFSALAGTSLTVAVMDGRLQLGTYQNLLLLELDGPKQREVRCFVP
jgi:secondary thiamine-phosphate synthase enzyme